MPLACRRREKEIFYRRPPYIPVFSCPRLAHGNMRTHRKVGVTHPAHLLHGRANRRTAGRPDNERAKSRATEQALVVLTTVRQAPNRSGSPRFLGKNYHTPPNFQKLPQQLDIWIFMPHRSDVYKKVAFRREDSPIVVRFAIRPIPMLRRAKTSEKSPFIARFRPRRNGHLSHRKKSETGR